MASLMLSSLNFNNQASINEPSMIIELCKKMLAMGVKPELEAFDSGMINYAKHLIKKGLITPPHYLNLILGNIACAQADLLHAGLMVHDLPKDSFISIGDAGAVVTNDKGLNEKVRQLRNYGASKKDVFVDIGRNSRMDEIQAAILGIKLKYLDSDNEKRRVAANYYISYIKNPQVTLPKMPAEKSRTFGISL